MGVYAYTRGSCSENRKHNTVIMEQLPKSNYDSLSEEMKLKGFHPYNTIGLFETKGVSGKNNPDGDMFKFEESQVQTLEEAKESIKNLPEFAEVKDRMDVELIEIHSKAPGRNYYVFIKINE